MHRTPTLPLVLAAALVLALAAPAAVAAPTAGDVHAPGLWRVALDLLTAGWDRLIAATETGGTGDKGLGLDPDGTDPGGEEEEPPPPPPPDDPSAPPPPG
jgi:hypothetical protein